MDLKDLVPTTDTVTVEIEHPVTREIMVNPDGSPMTITVWLPHSEAYRKIMYKQADKRLADAVKSSDTNTRMTAEKLDYNSLEMMALATKEWNITFGGESLELTEENAIEIYTKVYSLRGQVDTKAEKANVFT